MRCFLLLVLLSIACFDLSAKRYLTTIYFWTEESGYPQWWNSGDYYHPAEAMLADGAGNIIYTSNYGLYRIDSASGKEEQLTRMGSPWGVCLEASGNILFGNLANLQITRLNPATGAMSSFAGTGVFGYTGDGGPATEAQLGRISALCFSKDSTLYLADYDNNCIRYIRNGIINSLNTGALNGPAAIALNPSENVLYILERRGHRLLRFDLTSAYLYEVSTGSGRTAYAEGCLAYDALIDEGRSMFVDKRGDIYFSDGTHCVRRIDSATRRMYTVVGKMGVSGWAGEGGSPDSSLFNRIGCIASMPSSGALLIADAGNGRLRLLTDSVVAAPVLPRYVRYCRWDKDPSPLVPGGNAYRWYAQPWGGSPLPSMPAVPTSKAGFTTFFASRVEGGVESPRAAITVQIKTLNTLALSDTARGYCYGTSFNELFQDAIMGWDYYYDDWGAGYVYTSFPQFSYYRDFRDTLQFYDSAMAGTSVVFWRATDTSGCAVGLDSLPISVQPVLPKPICDTYITVCHGDKPYRLKAEGTGLVWWGYPDGAPLTPVFPPGRTFQYVLWQTDSIGCMGIPDTIRLFVKPIPPPPTVPSYDYTFCRFGQAVPLIAYGDSVIWFDSLGKMLSINEYIPPTSEAGMFRYAARQMNEYGCLSPGAEILRVHVETGPEIEVAYNLLQPLVGFPVKLSARSTGSLIWDAPPGSDTLFFVPQHAGDYQHRIISVSERGCRDTLISSLYVGTEEYWNARIHVFPNPFHSRISISGIDPVYLVNFRLVDLEGKTVFVQEVPLKELSVDIPSSVPPGTYLLELNTVGVANPSILLRKE